MAPAVCPYCAGEDLRPVEAGARHCPDCDRRFTVTFLGLGPG
ncbi:MAG: hypothetical protein AB7V42_08185 [Thermoleophilia bacterium]